jgi:hypothetical protein
MIALLSQIVFAAPWMLAGLAFLPVLWFLLRAVPPAAVRRKFPAVGLLLGLKDDETTPDLTPWWLLLLRMFAIAALIVGFAGPVLNPDKGQSQRGKLLVVMDASWASAPTWDTRISHLDGVFTRALRDGRLVAFELAGDINASGLQFQAADLARSRLAGIEPSAWAPDFDRLRQSVTETSEQFETLWVSDGIEHPGRETLTDALVSRGRVSVIETGAAVTGLLPPAIDQTGLKVPIVRSRDSVRQVFSIQATGPDPSGVERVLARQEAILEIGEQSTEVLFELPIELRNRVQRFNIEGIASAGSTVLLDDAARRRKILLYVDRGANEGDQLLSPLHFLRRALSPNAELIEEGIGDGLLTSPDVVILADVAELSETDTERLTDWVERGGLLVRFAGPKTAASSVARNEDDPLMPVRLRAGGRTIGGAMSWGQPKRLQAFPEHSPFVGLSVADEITVSAQVMAQPDPLLADRAIAQLQDGTPLVTRASLGSGEVVFFHVTANAEWSNLPLSGLFVQMLERLAVVAGGATVVAEDVAGQIWVPDQVLDGFGRVATADAFAGVDGADLILRNPNAAMPPGLYKNANRRFALNTLSDETDLQPVNWPLQVGVSSFKKDTEVRFGGYVLLAAVLLLLLDQIATLWLSGRILRVGRAVAASIVLMAGLAVVLPDSAVAQSEHQALRATGATVLAYVETGDAQTDDISHAGLRGLSVTLFQRTAIEPSDPLGVNLETDELAFYPFLYWPMTQSQPVPSEATYAKLNDYLRTGGMILFDTRDADIRSSAGQTRLGTKFRTIAGQLNIPPLEIVPPDHILTRSFYLLQDFPGRYSSPEVWVEASDPDAQLIEGMPFRNLNDGVTPVVVGGNNWAAAWAIADNGAFLLPVGRGANGERQREIALRFGVNLIMHVLTGNYKSDQVHIPALLERLGQ